MRLSGGWPPDYQQARECDHPINLLTSELNLQGLSKIQRSVPNIADGWWLLPSSVLLLVCHSSFGFDRSHSLFRESPSGPNNSPYSSGYSRPSFPLRL